MSNLKPHRPAPPFSLPLEGRLLAHRRILVELVRDLPPARRAEMLDWLDEGAIYRVLDVDSGAASGEGPEEGPEEEIEQELARADEFQVLRRLVRTASG